MKHNEYLPILWLITDFHLFLTKLNYFIYYYFN